jgi:hypothetical protein
MVFGYLPSLLGKIFFPGCIFEKVFSKHGSFSFLVFECFQTSIKKLFSNNDTKKSDLIRVFRK